MAVTRHDLDPDSGGLQIGEATIQIEHKSGRRVRLRIDAPDDVRVRIKTGADNKPSETIPAKLLENVSVSVI